jgi:hypothetical protein|tara:strand:+ start:179 stop:628 length:450 start_codon:yes stop_codon:yes gene_type:complete
MRESRKRAVKYFDAKGINPNTRPEIERILDFSPVQTWSTTSNGTTTYPCTIEIEAFLFYLHLTVIFTDNKGNVHTFEGDSGGIGVGDITGAGVIYFGDLNTLLKATTFGVAFGAEDGGVVQVTWGTSGNATAGGIGEGLGAFGGSGNWS